VSHHVKGREISKNIMKKVLSFGSKLGFWVIALMSPVSGLAFAAIGNTGGTGPGAAQQPNGGQTPPTAQISSVNGVLDYFCLAFDYLFWFLIALAVVFGVIGAYRYLTSAGDSEKVKKANSTLLYAAIAIAVALLARMIPLIVGSFFNAGDLTSC
jgi:hypothetical protein